ncbi:hypothetical protein LVU08_13750 [Klebsiella pneumoniae]|nr:hypothetical protein [Klebsiella pneumoniae]
MYHLDNTSGVPEMPEPKDPQSISPRWFGESQEQGGISWPGADWFNMVQAEFLSAARKAGLTPQKDNFEQLSEAMRVLGDAILRENLFSVDGFKHVKHCPDISTLRSVKPDYHGQILPVVAYSEGWAASALPPMGGGDFYYDANDLTSPDDGVFTFVTPTGERWKRKNLHGRITLSQAGAPVDGVTPADDVFDRLHQAIIARNDLWQVDGEGLTYVKMRTFTHDISKYSLRNCRFDFTAVTDFSPEKPFYAYQPVDSVGSVDRRFTRKLKNVIFQGPGYRIEAPVHALRLHMAEDETLRQMTFENVVIRDFNAAWVFGSHAYLISFEKCEIWRCYKGISDVERIEGIDFTDSGENIRITGGLFNSLHMCMDLGTKELNINSTAVSFDYTGRTVAESFDQFVMRGTHQLNFGDCFFESGNENSGWFGVGFRTSNAANIKISGGIIRLRSTLYNSCPYFFFDESGLASFSIDDTVINGWGVIQWANRGLVKFRPRMKGLASQFTLRTTDDPILCNPDSVFGLDYQARGLDTSVYTDRYHNDRLTITESSISKEDGTVIPTLLIKKLVGLNQFCDVIVKFRRPVRAAHNSSIKGKIKFVPGTAMTSARNISAITGCMSPGRVNNQGVEFGFRSTTVTNTSLSLLDDTLWYELNASWGANYSGDFLGFEYDHLRLDLSGLALGDSIHLFNVAWYGAF